MYRDIYDERKKTYTDASDENCDDKKTGKVMMDKVDDAFIYKSIVLRASIVLVMIDHLVDLLEGALLVVANVQGCHDTL